MYKLLIVDDEPLTRQFFKLNTERLHPQWICAGEAGDGEEALALLDEGQQFDLIVTDIRMPGMSGLELVRALIAKSSCPHIAILSGYDEFTWAKEAMEYGVHYYLLKPIVNEELTDALSKIAGQLTAAQSEEAAYQTLLSLSAETRGQVARNFLRAVVTDNNMEIKVLYPMLHRLKISLLDAEGAIMIVDLDESQLLERGFSASHLALYRYIVHQTATELAAASPGAIPFIDHEERTVLFVAGEGADDVLQRCEQLFRDLSGTILRMTQLRLWGACGSPEMELLQLNASYRKANQRLRHSLFADPEEHTEPLIENTERDAKWRALDKAISSLHSATAENHDIQQRAWLQSIAETLEPMTRKKLLQFGAYMLKRISDDFHHAGDFHEEIISEGISPELDILLRHSSPDSDGYTDGYTGGYTQEEAISLYRSMLESFCSRRRRGGAETSGASEHEIVTRVKAYIEEHFAEPLSLAHIAEKMGVSASYLSSLFHQTTQESYIKFLTRVRMEHATFLLRKKPAEKVYDVAEKVGYLSVKHFSYVFKQHFGCPPGQYQEKAIH